MGIFNKNADLQAQNKLIALHIMLSDTMAILSKEQVEKKVEKLLKWAYSDNTKDFNV